MRGTLAPERRASDSPIAIACLRLVTFLPLRPLFSLPRFISCISRFTACPAFGLYLRRDDDFLPRLLEEERFEVLEPLLLREREELERIEELRFVPRCDEPLRELADERRREPDLRDEEPLREERLRLDRLVAAI